MAQEWNVNTHYDARLAAYVGELVKPGGTLAVVGFPRTRWPDLFPAAIGFAAIGVVVRVRGKWEHTAPIEAGASRLLS